MLDVRPCSEPAVIDAVLRSAWIGPKIRHDAREPGFIDHEAVTYHAGYLDERLAGIFVSVRVSPWEVEVHAGIARHALREGRALGRLFLETVFADDEVMRATAYVLGTLPTAANWCRRIGFVDEGCRRDACRIDGTPVDVICLGMTRADWLAGDRQPPAQP